MAIVSDHYQLMMKIMIFNCMTYYEKGISQSLFSSPVSVFIRKLSSVFDLSVVSITGIDDNPWCFIDGMNAEHEIWLNICAPVLIFLFIVFVFVILRYCCRDESHGANIGREINFGSYEEIKS